jgi:hypothetical protein
VLSARSPAGRFLRELMAEHGGVLDVERLRILGAGGTNVTYQRREGDAFVIKVPRKLPRALAEPGDDGGERIENLRQASLLRHFPRRWCIEQWTCTRPLRLAAASGSWLGDGPLTIQRWEPALADATRVRVQTGYFELELHDPHLHPAYRSVNDALLGGRTFDAAAYLELNPDLAQCLALTSADSRFRRVLASFLRRFRAYLAAEGVLLDLVGEDNVVMARRGRGWWPRIGSVVKGESWSSLEEALACARRGPRALDDLPGCRLALLNGIAVVRLVNALGLVTGEGRIVDLRLSRRQLDTLPRIAYLRNVTVPPPLLPDPLRGPAPAPAPRTAAAGRRSLAGAAAGLQAPEGGVDAAATK